MQHYGLILADNGSNWYFGGAAFPQWPDALVSLLKGIPASAFEAVNESCLMVSRELRPGAGATPAARSASGRARRACGYSRTTSAGSLSSRSPR